MTDNFNIWEGVYDKFSETPACGEGFDSERWLESSYIKTKNALKKHSEKRFTNNNVNFNTSPLFVISSILYLDTDILKILDFGGGMGTSFIELTSILPESENILFTIVEGNKTCSKAKTLFENDPRIEFKDMLPENKKYDIVHISSSLQYIEDWQGLLEVLINKYDAKYFIFNDLPAGEIEKTYVTIQNYYESKIPYLFFKVDDIIEEMEKSKYKMILKSDFQASIVDQFDVIPQNNFQENYKVGYAKTIVFKRM